MLFCRRQVFLPDFSSKFEIIVRFLLEFVSVSLLIDSYD